VTNGSNFALPSNLLEPSPISDFVKWLKSKTTHSVTGPPRYLESIYLERLELREAKYNLGADLTIAEAILLEKSIIAADYSGNLDFMTPDTSYMVQQKRVKAPKGAEAYSSRATWAEPDIDVAAEMMRTVNENPKEAQAKALTGQRDLQQRFTHDVVGTQMKGRLEEFWRTLRKVKFDLGIDITTLKENH